MKVKYYISCLLLTVVFAILVLPFSAAAASSYATSVVVINGLTLETKEKPKVINGTTMVPFRAIFEALGMSVNWNNVKKTVTGKKQGLVIELGLKKTGIINGKQYPLSQSPFLSNTGSLYVNLRFISEATGANVGWDNTNKIASITASNLPKLFSDSEIFSFELLRKNYTKKQMEELELKKTVNEAGGTTSYSNDVMTYTFFDFNHDTTPGVVDVHGDQAGPRGINKGDTFDHVMSLFPQMKDWKSDSKGIFYEQNNSEARGYVHVYEGGIKEITVNGSTNYPFMRLFFKDNILIHYSFFLIDGTH